MLVSSRRWAQFGLAAAGVVFASSLSILLARSPYNQPVVHAIPAGDSAPAFRLHDLDGVTYDSSRLLGKAVVVFFSSKHNEVCDAYQHRVTDLARQYSKDPRVQFLAMNQDIAVGDQSRLLEVRVATKIIARPFPTLLDTGGAIARRFGARASLFAVIDPEGSVRYIGGFDDNRDPSKVTRQYVADELRAVLDEMPTAVATRS